MRGSWRRWATARSGCGNERAAATGDAVCVAGHDVGGSQACGPLGPLAQPPRSPMQARAACPVVDPVQRAHNQLRRRPRAHRLPRLFHDPAPDPRAPPGRHSARISEVARAPEAGLALSERLRVPAGFTFPWRGAGEPSSRVPRRRSRRGDYACGTPHAVLPDGRRGDAPRRAPARPVAPGRLAGGVLVKGGSARTPGDRLDVPDRVAWRLGPGIRPAMAGEAFVPGSSGGVADLDGLHAGAPSRARNQPADDLRRSVRGVRHRIGGKHLDRCLGGIAGRRNHREAERLQRIAGRLASGAPPVPFTARAV